MRLDLITVQFNMLKAFFCVHQSINNFLHYPFGIGILKSHMYFTLGKHINLELALSTRIQMLASIFENF